MTRRNDIKILARELRKNMTESEKILWEKLRKRRLLGLRFNRQYPINYMLLDSTENWFIADFFCQKKKIIIEVDGPIHDARIEYDHERDETLRAMGYNLIRIKNEDVNRDLETTLDRIKGLISSLD